tara:strand:+ start:1098 stop:1310 length:213 start_codon:yes stop_codon:yes gene_type:complete
MSDREIMRSKYETRKPYKDMKQPDAKKHQTVSFIKSAIRIVGYCFIPFSLGIATTLLIFSEIIGILEELV